MDESLHTKEKTATNKTRLIYNDVTAIKVILFIIVVLILTYFLVIYGVGVEIVFFLCFFMAPQFL